MSEGPPEHFRLSYFDNWKGVAIIWIAAGHFSSFLDVDLTSTSIRMLFNFSQLIEVSVDIFFIISGYFVAASFFRTGDNNALNILSKRFIRISLPYYALILSVLTILLFLPDIKKVPVINTLPPIQKDCILLETVISGRYYIFADEDGNKFSVSREKSAESFVLKAQLPHKYNVTNGRGVSVINYTNQMSAQFNNKFTALKRGDKITFTIPNVVVRQDIRVSNPEGKILPYLLFYQSYDLLTNRLDRIPLLNHLWYISVMLHYILIFAICYHACSKLLARWWSMNTIMLTLLIISAVLVSTINLIDGRTYVEYQLTQNRLFPLLLGSIGYILRHSWTKEFDRFIINPYTLGIALLGSCLLITYISFYGLQNIFPRDNVYLIFPLVFSILMFSSSGALNFPGVLSSVGRNSYGIYLVHYPMIILFVKLNGSILSNFEMTILYLLSSIFMGFLFEKLLNKFIVLIQRPA